ncbi:alkaline phosphatase [Candidatus Berkelbacteria bacterium CG23_combo_of_CG06-09_8_20_14_all_41_73]|uniref:Alkaline phosphatase n=2 Tax=Candidatus Berkelbacteria TaxID=1618330 RepID=A0A2M7K1L0_9BACT|nr:MAG: alkaline phosphatase [Candidatus Berkelbacteria bacterium CG23_combo_of_CG06-09_8_20_14_all_41_73]PIX30111.1 MAG: alkaline phosphatase [Candidatus Berkelbacteria bacterium CG_4_8_14_3_um_filter_42_13]
MIINAIANFVTSVISHLGYPGIFLLMALESAYIPIPSEIIMPFSGFLVSSGEMNFWLVVAVGSVGNLAGSFLAWWVGWRGGRPLVEKYGKYILLSQNDLESSDRFFKRYGEGTVFFSRLLPVVRTFISLPAGIAKMDNKKFLLYTLAGCIPFTALLTYAGLVLKDNWNALQPYFHKFDLIIALLIILAIIWFIFRHLRKK